jgi:hypothetical protein
LDTITLLYSGDPDLYQKDLQIHHALELDMSSSEASFVLRCKFFDDAMTNFYLIDNVAAEL